MLITTLLIIALTFLLLVLTLAKVFNFVRLPLVFSLAFVLIVVGYYVAMAEVAKRFFYKHCATY